MELIKLYTALMRRKWLVIQSVVFFVIAAGFLSVLLPKNYRASSRVMVNSSDSTMSILSDLDLSEIATGLSSSSDDITNKIALATTRPLLEQLIWRLQLRNKDGRLYSTEELLVPGMFGELEARPGLSVTQQQGTDILVFEATADDPHLARLIADTAVRLAVNSSEKRAREDTRNAGIFVKEQLEKVEDSFDAAMEDISIAQDNLDVLDLESQMKAGIARVSELMLSYESNAAAIQDLRGRISMQRIYQGRETGGLVSPRTAQLNAKVQAINTKTLQLREQRAEERTVKTEKHPDVIQIDLLLEEAQSELALALEEQHALDPTVQDLETQLSGLTKKGEEIQASIDRSTAEFGTYPDKMRQISQLQLTADAAEEVFKSLQEQSYQIGVAEAMTVSDLQPIEAAKPPERHYSPKLVINLVLGLALGGAFGFGLAFLFEYIDDTIKGPDDLSDVWDAPRLGVIPRFKGEGERRVIDALATTHPVAEAYRTVRNGLLFASLDKPLEIIAVSSALPSEGKSTFSVNMGVSFAREGKRVLIVDCDLRRPAQHRHFSETSNHQGVTDVLTGKLQVDEAIQQTPVPGLSMLTSGPIPTDPARLIESLRLRQLLLDLQKQYDLVIVDTPPSLVVNDSLVLSRVVDGIILVIEAHKTSRKLITDMRGRFDNNGIEPIGLVLNKMDFYSSGYGYYYKAYRQYHPDEVKPSKKKKTSSGGAA
jgi:capsular exopolysaccharide synthesis family protein